MEWFFKIYELNKSTVPHANEYLLQPVSHEEFATEEQAGEWIEKSNLKGLTLVILRMVRVD
jgi:hypothetical protein